MVELHISEDNLYHPEEVVKYIQEFKSKGVKVYLHHPSRYRGQYLDIISSSQEMRDYYDWSCRELAIICKQEEVKCTVHCHYAANGKKPLFEPSLKSGNEKTNRRDLAY